MSGLSLLSRRKTLVKGPPQKDKTDELFQCWWIEKLKTAGIWAFQLLTNKLFDVTAKLFETVA